MAPVRLVRTTDAAVDELAWHCGGLLSSMGGGIDLSRGLQLSPTDSALWWGTTGASKDAAAGKKGAERRPRVSRRSLRTSIRWGDDAGPGASSEAKFGLRPRSGRSFLESSLTRFWGGTLIQRGRSLVKRFSTRRETVYIGADKLEMMDCGDVASPVPTRDRMRLRSSRGPSRKVSRSTTHGTRHSTDLSGHPTHGNEEPSAAPRLSGRGQGSSVCSSRQGFKTRPDSSGGTGDPANDDRRGPGESCAIPLRPDSKARRSGVGAQDEPGDPSADLSSELRHRHAGDTDESTSLTPRAASDIPPPHRSARLPPGAAAAVPGSSVEGRSSCPGRSHSAPDEPRTTLDFLVFDPSPLPVPDGLGTVAWDVLGKTPAELEYALVVMFDLCGLLWRPPLVRHLPRSAAPPRWKAES